MIDLDNLGDMHLPKANYLEELETISEQQFQTLFHPSKFELCTKDKRDKGVDFIYEIKRNNQHLGFRFIVQLKSTESIEPNKIDGSFSLSIDTSNINALLHNGHPAFYILYVIGTKTFYYEELKQFLKQLNKKNNDWSKNQASHVLRFYKKLLPEDIELIYSITLKNGIFQRQLTEKTLYISNSINNNDRISIDSNFEITDDSEIRSRIERDGLVMINKGLWSAIISMHRNATGNVAASALYNLILGIANYYNGNRWDSISFFSKANHLKEDLSNKDKGLLIYFDTTVRYASDLITIQEYNDRLLNLENNDLIGLFIKLDKARNNFMNLSEETPDDQFNSLIRNIEEIMNHPKADESVILTAKCELIHINGHENNANYLKGVMALNDIEELYGVNLNERIALAKKLVEKNEQLYKDVNEVIEKAKKSQNDFAYYTVLIYEARIAYHLTIYTSMVFIKKELPDFEKPEKHDNMQSLEKKVAVIETAAEFFNQIGHIENMISAFSIKYEILHFMKRIEDAKNVLDQLDALANKFDLLDYKQKLVILRNGGTTHELFRNFLDSEIDDIDKAKKHYYNDDMIHDMIRMDDEEKKEQKNIIGEKYTIHLYPIGYFQFPKDQKEVVYKLLHITNSKIKEIFDERFEMVIPIANIYNNPVETEGLEQGELANNGMESWKNIYRIRKAFYDNKFYRNRII